MSKVNQTFKEVGAPDGRWTVENRPWVTPFPNFTNPNPEYIFEPAFTYTTREPSVLTVDMLREASEQVSEFREESPYLGPPVWIVNTGFVPGDGWQCPPGEIVRCGTGTVPAPPAELPFVVCSKCERRITPEDSYPVVWTGTKSLAELCEGCFRAEEAAGRARPCVGLDEEAT